MALIVLSVLAAPFVNLTRWYVVRIRAHLAARNGAWLATSLRMSETAAAEEVRGALDAGTPRIRREAVSVSIGPANSRLAAPFGLVEVRVRVRIPWIGPRGWLERGERGEVVVEESCVVAKAPRYGF